MPLAYHDKRRAAVNVGHALAKRGWKLWGYHEDQPDSMTGYFHPASWDGIATHPDLVGFVVCINVSQYDTRKSGQPDSKGVSVPAETCPRCHGAGIETVALPTWPVFQATPRGKMWHVEHEGQIIASGTGFNQCYHIEEHEHRPGVEAVVNAILAAITKAIASAIAEGVEEINAYLTETGQEKPPRGVTTYTVEQDREWTWIKFPGRPTNAILAALQDKLDARWSKRYQAWYVHRLLSQDEVAAALGAAPERNSDHA